MAQPSTTDDAFDEDMKLGEDNDTPFSEPLDRQGFIKPDHPSTDTKIDEHEAYDEGLTGSAEAEEP